MSSALIEVSLGSVSVRLPNRFPSLSPALSDGGLFSQASCIDLMPMNVKGVLDGAVFGPEGDLSDPGDCPFHCVCDMGSIRVRRKKTKDNNGKGFIDYHGSKVSTIVPENIIVSTNTFPNTYQVFLKEVGRASDWLYRLQVPAGY